MAGRQAAKEEDVAEQGWVYDPLPSQALFHELVGNPEPPYIGYSGPIGSGKSYALVYQALLLAGVNAGLPGLLGAPTYPMLRDATQRTMFEVLALEGIEYRFHKTENIIELLGPRFFGAEILFRSLDEFERLRGTNLAWFGIDELTYCREEAWTRLLGRIRHPQANRRCGFAVWTPRGYDWVFQRFIGDPKPGYKAILASPRENKYITQTGMYDALEATYDERLYRQEVLGEYLNLTSGQAYYAFDRKENIKPLEYDPNLLVCWSLDFNIDPMCSVIVQIRDESSRTDVLMGRRSLVVCVIDELFLPNSNTQDACEEFAERVKALSKGRPVQVFIYGDPSGSKRQTAAGAGALSDWALIRQFFAQRASHFKPSFRYTAAAPAVRDRVAAVNAALCNTARQRRLFIDPRCKHLITDLEQVTFKAGTGKLDQSANPQLTHISDALGYLVEREMGLHGLGGQRPERLI